MGVLGPGSLDSAPVLQTLLRRELADAREYQQLSRRGQRPPARMLAALSGEKKHRAKRLAAAYFLISGVRYWPVGAGGGRLTCRCRLLRRHFWEEQEGEAAYRAAAAATADPCLQELYIELAEDENSHIWLLRGILEAM